MKLLGGIYLDDGGVYKSVRAMHLQQDTMGIVNKNIVGFNKVGYQKNVPYIMSFAEYLGPYALSSYQNDEVGRLKLTQNPLDLCLATKGYFQVQTKNGVELTRDGRFKLDKDGYLLTLQDAKVLSQEGKPVKFSKYPQNIEQIKIDSKGNVQVADPNGLKMHDIGTIAVVSADSKALEDVNMKQGYVEESNVSLQEEAYSLITMRRNFQANKQLFVIQNSNLSRVLQELGRA